MIVYSSDAKVDFWQWLNADDNDSARREFFGSSGNTGDSKNTGESRVGWKETNSFKSHAEGSR